MPYRAWPKKHELERNEIVNMELKVVEMAHFESTSLIIFASKKNGTLRCWVDYKKLNAVAVRDWYSILRMEECISTLGGAPICSSLCGSSCYWRVEIAKADRDKIAFLIHHWFFQWIYRRSALRDTSGTLQYAMVAIIFRLHYQFPMVYLYQIMTFSSTPKEHIKHIRHFLTLICNASITIKLKKSEFFSNAINFLGHVIHTRQMAVSQHTIDRIDNTKALNNNTELQVLLALCSVVRAIVPSFTQIAGVLEENCWKSTNTLPNVHWSRFSRPNDSTKEYTQHASVVPSTTRRYIQAGPRRLCWPKQLCSFSRTSNWIRQVN